MLDLLLYDAKLVFPREGQRSGSLGVKDGKIAGVFLDTSQAQFDHQRDLRADLALRFRIADPTILEAGG